MKKILVLLLAIILLTTIFTSNTIAKKQETNSKTLIKYEKAYRYEVQGWIYIHIEGQPYERGYQYGYLASEEIIDIIYRWCHWGYENRVKSIINIKNIECLEYFSFNNKYMESDISFKTQAKTEHDEMKMRENQETKIIYIPENQINQVNQILSNPFLFILYLPFLPFLLLPRVFQPQPYQFRYIVRTIKVKRDEEGRIVEIIDTVESI